MSGSSLRVHCWLLCGCFSYTLLQIRKMKDEIMKSLAWDTQQTNNDPLSQLSHQIDPTSFTAIYVLLLLHSFSWNIPWQFMYQSHTLFLQLDGNIWGRRFPFPSLNLIWWTIKHEYPLANSAAVWPEQVMLVNFYPISSNRDFWTG